MGNLYKRRSNDTFDVRGGFKLCGYSISDPWLTRTVSPFSLSIGAFPFSYFLLIFGLCNKNGDPNFRSSYGAASSGENHMACDRPKFIHDVRFVLTYR